MAVTPLVVLAMLIGSFVVPAPMRLVVPGKVTNVGELLTGISTSERNRVTVSLVAGSTFRPSLGLAAYVGVSGRPNGAKFSSGSTEQLFSTHGQGDEVTFEIGLKVGAEAAGLMRRPTVRRREGMHGRSGGLAVALGTYQALSTKQFRSTAFGATGSINMSGLVIPVNHIEAKVLAARRAKLEYLLVPVENAQIARKYANEEIVIVPVHSVRSAIDWLMKNSAT